VSQSLESLFGGEPSNVRCSDADRDRYVEVLKANAAAGRITDDELSTRVGKALHARTMGELQALIADLPEGNVNPVADLVGTMVQTSVRTARFGIELTMLVVAVSVVLPVAIGIGATTSSKAGLIAAAVILVPFVLLAAHLRRRR
jgi:hypothetical protein